MVAIENDCCLAYCSPWHFLNENAKPEDFRNPENKPPSDLPHFTNYWTQLRKIWVFTKIKHRLALLLPAEPSENERALKKAIREKSKQKYLWATKNRCLEIQTLRYFNFKYFSSLHISFEYISIWLLAKNTLNAPQHLTLLPASSRKLP